MTQKYLIEQAYEYDPNDIAVAFYDVATKRYGSDALSGLRHGLFGWSAYPLALCSVKVDHHKQARGVRGLLSIKAISASFRVGGEDIPNSISVFNVRPEQQEEVAAFLDAIAEQLDKHSIYRGKAIASSGGFLDLSSVSQADAVYNEKVFRDLRAHVWTVIEHADLCDSVKAGLPRKVLFEGPYGSGKTFAALLTAQIALRLGWTFFYVMPTSGGVLGVVQQMLAFARRDAYSPSILFIEDIDREQRDGNSYELGAIMTEIDGICSKDRKILVIMTTNHNDKLSQGICRPGRIDKVIRFGTFTASDVERLLRKIIPVNWLDTALDWSKVTSACTNFSQAFVCEVGKPRCFWELVKTGIMMKRRSLQRVP
ncbi:MAG: ATP-binding protein [Patescibacteria group bacterium]